MQWEAVAHGAPTARVPLHDAKSSVFERHARASKYAGSGAQSHPPERVAQLDAESQASQCARGDWQMPG
jgi:hypothetical protein